MQPFGRVGNYATGKRLRDLPLTRKKIKDAIDT
jgi:CO/xanthine dehydrogenase Mo-binding subunit